MFEKKINWRVYFFIFLFGGVLLLVPRAIHMLLTDQVTYEDGVPIPLVIRLLLVIVILLPSSSFLITFISSLKRVFVYKRTAFKVDENGIHNAIIFIHFLAFFYFLNVKFIPWESITFISNEKNSAYVRVKTNLASASFLGKILLKFLGFNFCEGFTTQKLTQEEANLISAYCNSKSPHLKSNTSL